MTDPATKTPSDSREVGWLYAHFAGISAGGNRLLASMVTTSAISLAAFASAQSTLGAPGLGLEVSRSALLAASGLVGAILCLAYTGHYEMGARAIEAISKASGRDYGELWMLDQHPNLIDFIRHAREEDAAERSGLDRFLAAMLYPGVLCILTLWFAALCAWSFAVGEWSEVRTYLGFIGVVVTGFSARRTYTYSKRRWDTLRASTQAPAAPPGAG